MRSWWCALHGDHLLPRLPLQLTDSIGHGQRQLQLSSGCLKRRLVALPKQSGQQKLGPIVLVDTRLSPIRCQQRRWRPMGRSAAPVDATCSQVASADALKDQGLQAVHSAYGSMPRLQRRGPCLAKEGAVHLAGAAQKAQEATRPVMQKHRLLQLVEEATRRHRAQVRGRRLHAQLVIQPEVEAGREAEATEQPHGVLRDGHRRPFGVWHAHQPSPQVR
mmetsp:Transcript_12859/g.34834  ORF Transcript_12859/g.34834 Transcript_12859/m.34834 type:complete len:219 (-) Transcript_12859:620-1276(-)